jgi:predicted dithiol-disulfide oxidoreductase (DUF899 family)
MKYKQASEKLAGYRKNIAELREKMRRTLAETEPEEVRDYEFPVSDGKRRLSELFCKSDELFMIHNMGRKCPYCTMWADGFNGVYHHLADRAAFVVSSPDAPEVQKEFASGRGWRFPMVSHRGTSFAADMGYGSEETGWQPGISIFRRENKRIVRLSDTGFHPLDDFSTVWHILDLLREGAGGWSPRFSYDR